MWTVITLIVAAALQARWRAERVRLEHNDDADRERRRADRERARAADDAGYAHAVEQAAERYDRAVTRWMGTIPSAYNRDSQERDEVACAASAVRRLREIRREEREHGIDP